MNRPLVYIIILSYNSERWLRACLTSVLATNYNNFRVIVVDNSSTDNSVAEIINFLPQVELVTNKENIGFVKGNNVGIERALSRQADYIVLLNPDTQVTSGWLAEMVKIGEAEASIGILGAVQYSYNDETYNSWTMTALANRLTDLASPPVGTVWIPMDWVEGACFMVKREVFQRIGLLAPIYFSFYEEIDFSRRAACFGYQTALVLNSKVHHYRGGVWKEGLTKSRLRDYFCDRGQFIFALTDPRRTLGANLKWYLITLLTKLKEVVKCLDLGKLLRLLVIQADLIIKLPVIYEKWRFERELVEAQTQ
jgi:GT2 family glycosyltransferase